MYLLSARFNAITILGQWQKGSPTFHGDWTLVQVKANVGLTGFLRESRSWCVTCAVTQGPVLVDSEFGLMMYYLCLEMFKFWISILDFPLTPSPSNDVAGPASKCGMIVLVSGYIWGRGELSGSSDLAQLTDLWRKAEAAEEERCSFWFGSKHRFGCAAKISFQTTGGMAE